MNAIGIFAGRGDVIVAMGFAILIGLWVGWQAHRLAAWLNSKRQK